jgi:hypothetical protein
VPNYHNLIYSCIDWKAFIFKHFKGCFASKIGKMNTGEKLSAGFAVFLKVQPQLLHCQLEAGQTWEIPDYIPPVDS